MAKREIRAADGALIVEVDRATCRVAWEPITGEGITECHFPRRLALRAAGTLLGLGGVTPAPERQVD